MSSALRSYRRDASHLPKPRRSSALPPRLVALCHTSYQRPTPDTKPKSVLSLAPARNDLAATVSKASAHRVALCSPVDRSSPACRPRGARGWSYRCYHHDQRGLARPCSIRRRRSPAGCRRPYKSPRSGAAAPAWTIEPTVPSLRWPVTNTCSLGRDRDWVNGMPVPAAQTCRARHPGTTDGDAVPPSTPGISSPPRLNTKGSLLKRDRSCRRAPGDQQVVDLGFVAGGAGPRRADIKRARRHRPPSRDLRPTPGDRPDHDIGALKQTMGLERQQIGIAQPGADEVDHARFADGHRARLTARRVELADQLMACAELVTGQRHVGDTTAEHAVPEATARPRLVERTANLFAEDLGEARQPADGRRQSTLDLGRSRRASAGAAPSVEMAMVIGARSTIAGMMKLDRPAGRRRSPAGSAGGRHARRARLHGFVVGGDDRQRHAVQRIVVEVASDPCHRAPSAMSRAISPTTLSATRVTAPGREQADLARRRLGAADNERALVLRGEEQGKRRISRHLSRPRCGR